MADLDIFSMTDRVVFNSEMLPYFLILLATLIAGLSILQHTTDYVSKCTHRKCFHLLALLMFLPLTTEIAESRRLWQFTVFAFNAVTVWLILLEIVRPRIAAIDSFFKRFSDERE